jgi:uncharacterized protein YggT (Ycf19 family)
MGAIDFILNLVGLLWWLSWRSMRFDPLVRSLPVTLVGTLKRAESRRLKGWPLAIALIAIISLRAIFYWVIGGSADWTPKLNLEFVVLAFRNDTLQSMAAFSALSFLRAFVVLYFWLAALTIINRSAMATDPVQKLVRLHLGRVARWPWPVQLLLPYLAAVVLWTGVEPLLVHLGIMGPVHSATHLFEQAALVGLGLLLSLKYLLPVFLCLHLIASYIYLGTSPVWDFIATTSDNVTAPLRPLPLRFARLDFTPLAGTILILALLHWLPNAILTRFAASQWGTWPQ